MAEIEQDTIDEVLRTGRTLLELLADEQRAQVRRAMIELKVALQELEGTL